MHCMSNIKRGLSILRGDGGQPNPSGASGGGSQIQMEGWDAGLVNIVDMDRISGFPFVIVL